MASMPPNAQLPTSLVLETEALRNGILSDHHKGMGGSIREKKIVKPQKHNVILNDLTELKVAGHFLHYI